MRLNRSSSVVGWRALISHSFMCGERHQAAMYQELYGTARLVHSMEYLTFHLRVFDSQKLKKTPSWQ
jgi:hypothetical protein